MKKNILVLNCHGLGDVIMSFPFIKKLSEISGDKSILILFKSRVEADLFKISDIYKNKPEKFVLFSMKNIKPLFLYMFRIDEAYSLGINKAKSLKLFRALMIKNYFIADPYCYAEIDDVKFMDNRNKLHKTELYFNLLKPAYGCDISFSYKDYFSLITIPPLVSGKYIVVASGSGELEKHKRMSPEQYKMLFTDIHDIGKHTIVTVGTEKEKELIEEVKVLLNSEIADSLIVMNGQTSLEQLISLLKGAVLVIGTDNGVLHIASACGAAVLGVFGPTDPNITGPYGENISIIRSDEPCAPCYGKNSVEGCGDNVCMKHININLVIESYLKKTGSEQE